MKIAKLILLAAVMASVTTGCVFHNFNPYVGDQRNWTTAPGSVCETVDGMEVFHGPPVKPYEILGELRLRAAPVRNVLKATVKDARARGADAIILQGTGTLLVPVLAGAVIVPAHQKTAEATLIRYKK